VFTFEADSGIAGTAFTTADKVVAAWGTLDDAGARLVQHSGSGRGATTAPFTWSDTEPPTVAPTTAPPTTATPTTATPTRAPTALIPTNVTDTPTKAPTTAPPASLSNCSDTERARIAACRTSSLQTEAACKDYSKTNADAKCRWCPSDGGLTAGCYVRDDTVVCVTTDGTSYKGDICPTNIVQLAWTLFGFGLSIFIGIIGAHLSA
jgi:hypothetical protein